MFFYECKQNTTTTITTNTYNSKLNHFLFSSDLIETTDIQRFLWFKAVTHLDANKPIRRRRKDINLLYIIQVIRELLLYMSFLLIIPPRYQMPRVKTNFKFQSQHLEIDLFGRLVL